MHLKLVRVISTSKTLCAREKETFFFSVSQVWSNQSAIFPFINRGHLRVVLRYRMSEKAHELFNLLLLSIEEILRREVSEYCRKHEQFFKFWTYFCKLCTLPEKREQNFKQEHLSAYTNISWKHKFFRKTWTLFQFVNIFIEWEHMLKIHNIF